MAKGLNINVNVEGLDKFKEYIEYVKKFSTIKNDEKFQKYIQNKFLETVNEISRQRLPSGNLTDEYISNNKIRTMDGGFILYNSMTIPTDSEGYDGEFNMALAFEYGTGIIGQQNPKTGAWQYNVNNHKNGWTYFENGTLHFTRGFEGYEIYRYTKQEIENRIMEWVFEYEK